ncbi:MAG: Uma2 family endonuclease [Candidatus Rokubacteria bacterium]|nr:Uma2 family endonuclease [Candidatus Rokubacteria bacterium]
MPRETYDRMVEHGILRPDDKVELLEGRLVVAEPKFSPHTTGVLLAADVLRKVFTGRWHIRTEAQLAIGPFSSPEPDVCVVAGAIRDYRAAHPTTAALVVEVAQTSLRLDRTIKKRIYAGGGIADYWIVNLATRVLEVYRDPVGEGVEADYRAVHTYTAGDTIAPLAAPDATIRVADLLP